MIRKLLIFLSFVLLFSSHVEAQKIDSKRYINKVHKEYVKQLNLTDKQSEQFKEVLETYNPKIKKLRQDKSKNHAINRMIKVSISEIYKILTPEQYTLFLRVKSKIEPQKEYKFDK